MPIILAEILNVPLQEIFTMKCLQSCYGNGVELLKRIIYLARRYLSHRPSTEIQTVCSDLLYLYQLYFSLQAEEMHKKPMKHVMATNIGNGVQKLLNIMCKANIAIDLMRHCI